MKSANPLVVRHLSLVAAEALRAAAQGLGAEGRLESDNDPGTSAKGPARPNAECTMQNAECLKGGGWNYSTIQPSNCQTKLAGLRTRQRIFALREIANFQN